MIAFFLKTLFHLSKSIRLTIENYWHLFVFFEKFRFYLKEPQSGNITDNQILKFLFDNRELRRIEAGLLETLGSLEYFQSL